MREYQVDLSNARSWNDFIEAFNKGFVRLVRGKQWNGNLDAFNDYLWWPEEEQYRLVFHGWTKSYATVNQHKTWDGRPVLDIILEIIQDNPQALVELL